MRSPSLEGRIGTGFLSSQASSGLLACLHSHYLDDDDSLGGSGASAMAAEVRDIERGSGGGGGRVTMFVRGGCGVVSWHAILLT